MKKVIFFLVLLLLLPLVLSEQVKAESKIKVNYSETKVIDHNNLAFKLENDSLTINDRIMEISVYVGPKLFNIVQFNEKFIEETKGGYKLVGRGNDKGLSFNVTLDFYNDSGKQMKMEYGIDWTNAGTSGDVTVYHTFEINKGESYEIGLDDCNQKGCVVNEDLDVGVINFNDSFDFVFWDMISEGFVLTNHTFDGNMLVSRHDLSLSGYKGTSLHIDPTFQTNDIEGVAMAPLNKDNDFVLCWCDETTNDIGCNIFDAKGNTRLASDITIDSNVGNCAPTEFMGVAAANYSTFAVAYPDDSPDDFFVVIYDWFNEVVLQTINIDTGAGGSSKGDICFLNDVTYCGTYLDTGTTSEEVRAFCGYTNSSTEEHIESSISGDISTGGNAVISCYNSTDFKISWFDAIDQDISSATFQFDGSDIIETNLVVDYDTNVAGFVRKIGLDTFNETHDLTCFLDYDASEVAVIIANKDNINETRIVVGPDVAGLEGVDCESINETHFATAFTNGSTTHQVIADVYGNIHSSNTVVSATTEETVALIATRDNMDQKICFDNFIVATQVSSSQADFYAYNSSGDLWDGICVESNNPTLQFLDPTPADSSSQADTHIDVSLNTTDENGHYSFVDFNNDLLVWLTFANYNSSHVLDNSSYGGAAEIFNTTGITTEGYLGHGFASERGNDSRIEYLSQDRWQNLSEYTISMWYKRTVTGIHEIVDVGAGDVTLEIANNAQFRCKATNGTDTANVQNNGAAPLNQWAHYVCVYNGTHVAKWIDGKFVNNETLTGIVPAVGDLEISSDHDTRNLNGTIDEFIFLKRALGNDEISALYDSNSHLYDLNQSGLAEQDYTFCAYGYDDLNNTGESCRTVTISSGPDSCTYGGSGDWVVTDACVLTDEAVEVDGSVFVNEGGSLFLNGLSNLTSSELWALPGTFFIEPTCNLGVTG